MGAEKIGLDQDVAGGKVTATTSKTLVEGKKPIRIGDSVASHGTGDHASATMKTGSGTVKIEGKYVCRDGDEATCGHTLVSTATKSFAG